MIIIAISLGIIPSLIWLVFFLHEDIHPEPKKAVIKVFIFGALSALAAIIFQSIFEGGRPFLKIAEHSIIAFFIFALIEEFLKFSAAYYIMRKNKYFDEPVDAMIYMITAGLGFAMMENILVGLNGVLSQGMDGRQILAVIILRFTGATLLHALSSAIIGYYWAKSLKCKADNSACQASHVSHNLIVGIIIAALLHGFFNYLIINYNNIMIIFPMIFLAIMAMFVLWDFEKIKIKLITYD